MSLRLPGRPNPVLSTLILGLALLAAAPLGAGVNRWTSIGPYGGDATALEFSANGRTAWAGTRTLGVFRSVDNGLTWREASLGLSGEVLDLAASSTAAGWVYAVTSSGVYRSEDAGLHWTAVNKGLPVVDGRVDAIRVATEPTEPAAVWVVGLEGTLYRSTDLGARWRSAGRGIKGYVADVAAHPQTAGVVFAATNQGLFRSADSGAHWSPAGLRGLCVSQVVFDRVQPRHLYAITLEEGVQDVIIGEVFFSDDGGASWKQGNQPDIYGRFELVADPTRAGIAWLSSSESSFSVLRTRDGGQNWQGVLRSDRFGTLALAANPLRSGTVLAGNLNGGTETPAVFRTDTGGTSWSPSGTGLAAQAMAKVLPDPSKPGALYALGCCSLWKRTGAGQPFTPFSPTLLDADGYRLDFRDLIFDPKTPATLYLVASGGSLYLYKSVDAGATWQQAGQLSSIIDSFYIDSITIDPAHPSRLYGTSQVFHHGIYRSDDGGFSWSLLSGYPVNAAGLVTVTATAVYMHSFDDEPSYRHYLRRSTDGGTTWTNLLDLGGASVEAVAEDPRDPRRLWAAFIQFGNGSGPDTGGVYRSTDGGAHWSPSRVAGNRPVLALALDPRNSNRVWAASSGAVFLSEDGGATWVSVSEGLPALDVSDLRLDPHDPDTLYAGTVGGSVYELTRRRL